MKYFCNTCQKESNLKLFQSLDPIPIYEKTELRGDMLNDGINMQAVQLPLGIYGGLGPGTP